LISARLEKETKKLSKKTSFTQMSLILFVLTGIKPVSSPYTFSKSFFTIDEKHMGKKIVLHIYKLLTKKMVDNIYWKIKEFFGKKEKSFLDEKHLDLDTLVDKYGGVPKKGKTDFWINIQKEINKKYPNWFNDPKANGPRITYNRIKRRLQI
jgi:hypothetical protein